MPLATITPGQIAQAANYHVDENLYGAVGTTTKCNFFACDVVEQILQQTRPDLRTNSSGGTATANDQFDNLSASADWAKQGFSSDPQTKFTNSLTAANAGSLIVVAYKNPDASQSGHIAIIVPAAALEHSDTWGMDMPLLPKPAR
jgi:hypothetical protein